LRSTPPKHQSRAGEGEKANGRRLGDCWRRYIVNEDLRPGYIGEFQGQRVIVRPRISGHFFRQNDYHEIRKQGTDDWLILHTLAGRGLLYLANGQTVEVEPGETVLYRPRARQEYATDPQVNRWELIWAHFHPLPAWEKDLAIWPPLATGIFLLPRPAQNTYRRALRALRSMVALEGGPWRLADRLAMNALEEALLWFSAANDSPHGTFDPQVSAAQKYLCDNLGKNISLTDLAEVTAQSVSKLSHAFGKQTGLSPRAFLEQRRLTQAARLLGSTRLPIKDIARQVGFANPFYFSLRFKKQMGLSPLAWRKSNAVHVLIDEQRTVRSRHKW
jgi:AraC family transcriptional regulator of arabinose operon